MVCSICKFGTTDAGEATVTLERNGSTIVFQHVPAQLCDNCGEQYLDESTTEHLLAEADRAARSGVQVEIRRYAAG
jgi:YgiT-type zinc finger domain-containing protein